MLSMLVHRPGKGVSTLASVDEARAALAEEHALVWVDFDERTPVSDELLLKLFKVHPLAVEDIYKEFHRPKLEDFDEYLYIVVQVLRRDSGWDLTDVATTELDLLLGANFVVTHHAGPLPAVDAVREPTLRNGKNFMERGSAFLAHALLDSVVDRYKPLAVELDHAIDCLEAEVLRGVDRASLEHILELTRSLHHLRRIVIAQREVLERLARDQIDEVPDVARPFFRDVHEHMAEMCESLDIQNEDLASLFNAFHSLAAHRMNEVMKLLTLMSTVFMPLTFIVGVYGMNFEHMPELKWRSGYYLVWGVMIVTSVVMGLWFRARRWW